MTSPAVWDDALSRATAACAALGLPLEQVNRQQGDHSAAPIWVLFETATHSADRMELGPSPIWEEDGQIWLHLAVSAGAGLRDGIVARKALATAFRLADQLPAGLVYQGMSFDPAASADDGGNWVRLSLAIDYRYQDIAGAV